MPEPPPQEPPQEPPGEGPPTTPPPPDDEAERLLDEAFKLGEGDQAWLEIARRASRPAEPLGNLGPYALLEEIGRGGQGEVYKAVQPGTGRTVALKRLAAGGLRIGSRAAERFSREVDAATRLSHPNVVTVFAAEVIDGHAVLVMEYVDGTTIDRWADACWADPTHSDREKRSRVLRAFAAACDGVAHAHQRGVIHRDLKPSNIMIGADGVPRVLDFGVAKVLEEWREQDPSGARATAWTATGFAGTPAYAPPEQLHEGGRAVDTRADVYALGVILYRLLSGEEAFGNRQGLADLLDAVRRGPARRPSQARPSVGREADWIVRKAMEADAARRYQTVDALAEDVRRLLDGRAVLAHPPSAAYTAWRAVRRRPRTWGAAILAATAITVLSAVASVQAARLGRRSDDLAAALRTANEQRDRAEKGEARQASLNRRFIQAMRGGASPPLFARALDPDVVSMYAGLLEQLTPDDSPEAELELRMRYGFSLQAAQRLGEADEQLRLAQQLSDRLDDPAGERAARLAFMRSGVLRTLGLMDDALQVIDRAIARAATSTPTIHSAVLHLERLNVLRSIPRPLPELLECGRMLVAACDAHPDRFSERARAREEAAGHLLGQCCTEEAEAWLREALEMARTRFNDPASLSRFQFRLSSALALQGRWEEAEPLIRAAAQHRYQRETANSRRAHWYLLLHGETLSKLGRFEEAAQRLELSLIRPLAAAQPNRRLIACIRLRLAAAHLAVGNEEAGRLALCLALTEGRHVRPASDDTRDTMARITTALRENGWQIDERLRPVVGDKAWLLDRNEFRGIWHLPPGPDE